MKNQKARYINRIIGIFMSFLLFFLSNATLLLTGATDLGNQSAIIKTGVDNYSSLPYYMSNEELMKQYQEGVLPLEDYLTEDNYLDSQILIDAPGLDEKICAEISDDRRGQSKQEYY